MNTLTEDQIQEIAETFDMGMTCFWNKVTGELVFVPKQEYQDEMDMELFEEDMQKIEDDYENFLEIAPPSSSDQFQIMADFAEQLDENQLLQDQLISALIDTNLSKDLNISSTIQDHTENNGLPFRLNKCKNL